MSPFDTKIASKSIAKKPTKRGGFMGIALARQETHTTTVRLPRPVYDQARCVVDKEKGGISAISLNDLIVAAITTYLKMYKRRQIDAAFACMAQDADYQKEAKLLAEEFEYSDWEALMTEEEELKGEPAYASSSAR
jgi:hypothetical protein